MRSAVCVAAILACGRSQGVPDDKLGGLVVETKAPDTKIDVDKASQDPLELGRALGLSHAAVSAALGAHTQTIKTGNTVEEAGKPFSMLTDETVIELGDQSSYHAVYTNSADYGREAIFTGGLLYLRP